MGTAFEIFPFVKPDRPLPPSGGHECDQRARERTESQTIPSVLLIEDNPSDVHVIRRALRQSGIQMQIQVMSDGEQALSFLAQFESPEQSEGGHGQDPPSLILLDWNLPRVSGPDLLAYIRRSDSLRGIPVVVVTSTNSPADVAEMRRLKANAHFRKPTDLDAYLALKAIVLDLLSEPPERPS